MTQYSDASVFDDTNHQHWKIGIYFFFFQHEITLQEKKAFKADVNDKPLFFSPFLFLSCEKGCVSWSKKGRKAF